MEAGTYGVRRHDAALDKGDMLPFPAATTSWHHAPLHRLEHEGIYMVTAGTKNKAKFFDNPKRLDLLQAHLFEYACGF